jgi:hypothetical protein
VAAVVAAAAVTHAAGHHAAGGDADPARLPHAADHCATPRTGLQPNGLPYYDLQGTLAEEKRWLRSFIDETYLWYAKCRPI